MESVAFQNCIGVQEEEQFAFGLFSAEIPGWTEGAFVLFPVHKI